MKRISKNIITAMLSIMVWTLSDEMYAQCKVDNSSPVKGEFEISGVKIKGDGGGLSTASNNIPIKICEGELINLKSTLVVNSLSNVNYWIIPLSNYNSLPSPPSNPTSATDGYTALNGDVDIKMTDQTTDSQGFKAYSTAGKYVITQYDNSNAKLGGPGFHHACQVIEIIKPTKPDVQYDICGGGKITFKFPATTNNSYDYYNLKYILSPSFQPQEITAVRAVYPLTFSSGVDFSGFNNVSIEVRGVSLTGGCPAPVLTIPSFSLNNNVINKPSLNAIVGTTLKGEFKLAISAANGVKRNIYIRDPTVDNFFNYNAPFKSYSSSATSGLDSNSVQVPNGDKTYCFQVEAVDASCATSLVSNPALRSNELCTTLISAAASNNKNVITWSQALTSGLINANFLDYRLERFLSDGTFDRVLFSSTDPTKITFDDNLVTCGQEYIYKIRTRYPQSSISQSIKVKAISTEVLSKIPFAFTTISNSGTSIRIQGVFDANNTPTNIKSDGFKFYRANSINEPYSFLKSGNSFFEDTNVDVSKQSYCYYMTWTNLCNSESEKSDKVCSIFLKSDGSNLNWTPETAFSVGTESYIVQRVNPTTKITTKELASNLIGINNFETKGLDESEGQEIYVQIQSRPVSWTIGSPNSLSNIIRVYRPAISLIPQIFTPNGDGNNDKFIVKGIFIKNLKMTIYDRWGIVIYYNEEKNYPYRQEQIANESTLVGWDGTMNNGNRAIEGSYVYKIEIEDFTGQTTYKEGALLLAY